MTTATNRKAILHQIKHIGKYRFIRSELLKKNIQIQEIAADLGVNRYSVRLVMQDKMVSRRIAAYLEKALEFKAGTLFSYTKNGGEENK